VERLHRAPLKSLIGEIVTGELVPGQQLPNDVALGEQFGVSRATSRELVRGLEQRGLISVKQRVGATVNPQHEWDMLDADVLACFLSGPRKLEIDQQTQEARRIFEIEAAALAAELAEPSDLAALRASFAGMATAAARAGRNPAWEADFHVHDVGFHQATVRAAKNEMLAAMAGKIHEAILGMTTGPNVERWPERVAADLEEHAAILAAIEQRDPEAARAAAEAHYASVDLYYLELDRRRRGR
jgi:GntR family transcriptional repressor for pyruvate dehydrogenase complex